MAKKNYDKLSLVLHRKYGGKLELGSKFSLKTKDDLSIAYTPGVASVCMQIYKDKENNKFTAKDYTLKKNTIAVISDGSAVLGLGNIGADAAIPVMEGKAILMKHFAQVDAFPICINNQDTEKIIETIKNIQSVFGGINLEDISAPRCFEIEERLRSDLDIPVMHDDQWGAATVTLAALINSLKVVGKKPETVSVALVGAGAAGIATAKLLGHFGVKNLTMYDTKGAICSLRKDLNPQKQELIPLNTLKLSGELKTNLHEFDVFIGLSKPNLLATDDVKVMSSSKGKPIIFALANPTPEIMPEDAKNGGAYVVGTGRSDFPNQINNSVFFPGFWRGMLDRQNKNVPNAKDYDFNLFLEVAKAIAKILKPNRDHILPSTLDTKVHKTVAKTVLKYKKQ